MNDYCEDEWYDDDHYEDWSESSVSWSIIKSENGHIRFFEGILTRYPGEDWGEASGWEENTVNLNDLLPEYKAKVLAEFKDKPAGVYDISLYFFEDDEEEEEVAS